MNLTDRTRNGLVLHGFASIFSRFCVKSYRLKSAREVDHRGPGPPPSFREQGVRKLLRVEGLEIVELFAEADEFDR